MQLTPPDNPPPSKPALPLMPGLGIKFSEQKALLRYIGPKKTKRDTLYGSLVTWNGPGDIQEVPANLMPHFLEHPDLWVEVGQPWTPPPPLPPSDHDLLALVREGDWQAIAKADPAVYARAHDAIAGADPELYEKARDALKRKPAAKKPPPDSGK